MLIINSFELFIGLCMVTVDEHISTSVRRINEESSAISASESPDSSSSSYNKHSVTSKTTQGSSQLAGTSIINLLFYLLV